MVKTLLALLVPALFLANMRMLYVEGLISIIVASVWLALKSTTVFVKSHEAGGRETNTFIILKRSEIKLSERLFYR